MKENEKLDYKVAYWHIVDLAKKNSDAFEYCLQGIEKDIDELKEKLRPFDDKYFRGLTNEQIAMLAKKSLRLTKENSKVLDYMQDLISKSEELACSEFKQYFDEEASTKILDLLGSAE